MLLLPATFEVVERTAKGWKAVSGPYATGHEARRSLDFALRWAWPRMHWLIPLGADPSADARSFAEGGAAAGAVAAELAGYAGAADALRAAGRVNRLQFRDTVYQIVRTRRLLRWGPGGPEGPRPSDVDGRDPARIHLPLDEDGNVHPAE